MPSSWRAGCLVPHREVSLDLAASPEAVAVLEPERVPFISYPYEWSFGQLRDAALLTLDLQERALARGLTLRDASAYNVQFVGGRPLFIDTLSFEPREPGAPWAGVSAVLRALPGAAGADEPGGRAAVGTPALAPGGDSPGPRKPAAAPRHLAPARPALPRPPARDGAAPVRGPREWCGRATRAERSDETGREPVGGDRAGAQPPGAVQSLDWTPAGTEWADYTADNNYSNAAADSKRQAVIEFLRGLEARTAWDLGANTGEYSRAARQVVPSVIAFDIDPAAVERNYRRVKTENETGILPLLLDLTNPSPALGWAHRERQRLEERGPTDVLLALAVVHHLAIGHNLPLERVAGFLARVGRSLIIEFVPKSDSQVRRLLRDRADIFPDYTREGFEAAFRGHFRIERAVPVAESERTLYLMTALPWHDT